MNPIRSLLRKDWLARRSLLLIWYGVLLLDLPVDLGLADRDAADSSLHSGWGVLLEAVFSIMSMAGAVLIAINTVREDTPAVPEQFLATRPVAPRLLWMAKVLFLLLFVVLPLLVRNAVYLLLSGQDLRTILLGTGQVALWVVPVLALVAAFAALWATRVRFLAALGIVSVLVWAFALAMEMLMEVRLFRYDAIAQPLSLLAATSLAALGLLLLTASRRMLRSPFRRKLAVAVLPPLAGLAFLGFGPSLVILPRTAGLPESVAVSGDLGPTTAGHRYAWVDHGDRKGIRLELNPDRPAGLPPAQDVVWRYGKIAVDGETTDYPELPPDTRAWREDLTGRLSPAFMHAVESHLGREVQWVSLEFTPTASQPNSVSETVPAREDSDQLRHFSAELQGSLFEWEVSAEVPLRPGALVEGEHGRWTVVSTGSTDYYDLFAKLRFARPDLWLSRRPEEQPSLAGRVGRDFAIVLYSPAQGRAFIQRNHYSVRSRGEGTGYVHRTFTWGVRGQGESGLLDLLDSPAQLRLLVLRPRYRGCIVRRWEDRRGIRATDLRTDFNGGLADRERTLSAGQLARWLEQQEKPAPSAPGAVVRSFLATVLGKTAHCRDSFDLHDPVVMQLAAYVPRHLEFFVRARRALAMDDHHLRRTLTSVLIQGVTPAQIERLVAALPDDVGLAAVLAARGWSEAARETLLAQFHAGYRDSLILSTLSSLGALDEQLPSLLAELRRQPTTGLYELLRAQAALDPAALDTAVRRLWRERPRVVSARSIGDFASGHLEVALRHGLPEAVAELHRRTRLLRSSGHRHDSYDPYLVIDRAFLMEGLPMRDRHEERLVVDWFLAHQPHDFRFDPITRRFVVAPRD